MTKAPPIAPATIEAPAVEGCGLGRDLGDCALRRVGCLKLHDVLTYLHPPYSLIAELRTRSDLAPDVRAWLARLDAIGAGGGHRRPSW